MRLRAETPLDTVRWGTTIPIRVTITNSGSHKVDHIRIKLKALDDTFRPGTKERRVTLMTREYWDGMPYKYGDYNHQFQFQLPNYQPYTPRVTYYLSVSAVMGVLVKNLRVRLALRITQ